MPAMSRLAPSLTDMLNLVNELTGRGIVIEFVKEKLVFDGKADSGGMLMLQIMGAVSEFERAMILKRQHEGIRIPQAKRWRIQDRRGAAKAGRLAKTFLAISRNIDHGEYSLLTLGR
jgi:DNA invertase Pin-like site-specific DNA recombinase